MYMRRNNNNFDNNSNRHNNANYTKRRYNEEEQTQEDYAEEDVKVEEGSQEQSEVKKPKLFNKNFERKQWRLIVRNLPFATKVEDLQNVCSKFGRFNEVVLPPSKTLPKKCAGFAFIQFLEKADAEKAKEHFNSNKFMNRSVAADWSLAKDAYETANHDEKQKLKEKVKIEKAEDEKKDGKTTKVKKFESDEEDEEDQSDEEDGSENGSDDDNSDEELEEEDNDSNKRPRRTDNAVEEGRVVFLRNISFDTEEDKLKEEIEMKVAEVDLAIICKFKDSGHSKGTAFVHFKTPEDAQKCIGASAMGELFLDGRPLNAILALPREKAEEMEKTKLTKVPKDNRNLRLLRFGLIREGTTAAKGMSKEDAAKRVKLAESAKKKLENLHMFVSPVRLVVHNLPVNMNDYKLRDMCRDAGGEGAFVTECRIWRDKTEDKLGKSKGFAFVNFDEHKHALACLTKMNNDPKMFTNDKRPIVEFCIENLAAIQAKERRHSSRIGDKSSFREINEKVRQQIKDSVGEIHGAGMKFLPKFLGKKLRHRDMTKSQKKRLNVKTTGKTKGGKDAKSDGKKGAGKKGAGKKGDAKKGSKGEVEKIGKGVRKNKKQMTKYLALR
ncbi:unnamed protein product [Auanema sp. JU1783]|nr:unnamed protein product [Auanema sp. JU1783]